MGADIINGQEKVSARDFDRPTLLWCEKMYLRNKKFFKRDRKFW